MLVERDPFLTSLLESVPDQGRTGVTPDGRWVFLGGEAGVGKTSLVGALLDRVATLPHPLHVRRGYCDNVATPSPLGPVIDAVPELAGALDETTPATRLRLFHKVRALLGAQPTLLLLEDVHWADEATLELVRFLGRRLDGMPLLAVATFRADEVGPSDRLTAVLGDLATVRGVARMHLPTLSAGAVAALVENAGSTLDPATLHERTGGNPFFVTEVLATGTEEAPATVRDAVLARAGRISPAARDVLGAAAVLGPGATLAQLTEVSGHDAAGVDECVRAGLLVADAETSGLMFRHEIARETVEGSLDLAARARLNDTAYVVLSRATVHDDHRLAHHAAGAGRTAEVVAHAKAAGARSSQLGAHREAVHEYRLALQFAETLDAREVAELHELLSYVCYLTDQVDDALRERALALALRQREGDVEAVGADQRWLSRLSWFLGRGEDAERYGDEAVATLEPLAPGHELAMAYSNRAQLAMLAGAEDDTVWWARRAVELARALGDREVESHALNNMGAAMSLGTNHVEGMARLQQSLDIALADDLHEHAARAYTNLGTCLVQLRLFAEADRALDAGITYCADRDLDSWRMYMSAWLAESYVEQARFADARRLARSMLLRPGLAPVTRIPALVVVGTVSVRTGDSDTEAVLEEARRLAEPTGEAQRTVPVAVARAEHAWSAGDLERAAREVAVVQEVDPDVLPPWDRGELAWWLRMLGGPARFEVDVPEPFRLMLDERWTEAAAAWDRLGCAWWSALSLGLSPHLDDARVGTEQLVALGATATRAAVLRVRHEAGLPVPRGPRQRTAGNPAGLTPRELEVLALLAEGLTNAQLAGRLFLSEKTVDHHVSSVLRKLGEPTRSGAVAAALQGGLLPNMGSPPDVPTTP